MATSDQIAAASRTPASPVGELHQGAHVLAMARGDEAAEAAEREYAARCVARRVAEEDQADVLDALGLTAPDPEPPAEAHPPRTQAARHGTYAGYRRHHRRGEAACEACLAAKRAHNRDYERERRRRIRSGGAAA